MATKSSGHKVTSNPRPLHPENIGATMATLTHKQQVAALMATLHTEWLRYDLWADRFTLIFVVSTAIAAPICTGYMLTSMALGNW